MMGFIVAFVFGMVFWFVLRNKKKEKSSDLMQVGEKAWIVNGEYVNFDDNSPTNIFKQKQEDRKHYSSYESSRLSYDREVVTEEFFKTKTYITNYEKVKECITNEKLNDITNNYNRYIIKCDKLGIDLRLNKEEFLIKEENIFVCGCLKMFMPDRAAGCYHIYSPDNAKYSGGMTEKIKEEFKQKWY